MGPKYEFTDKTMNHEGHLLHRIRRIEDGKLGGWIESEENLSQEGSCWVDGEAYVYDDARVYGNAQVFGDAIVCDNARVYGNAQVYDNAKIYDHAEVYGNAEVYIYARVRGNAKVYDNAKVYGDALSVFGEAQVYGNAQVYHNADVYDNAKIYGHAEVYWNAQVYGNAEVYDYAEVYHGAEVKGDSEVYDYAKVYGDEVVCDDYIGGDTEICDGYENYIDEDEDTSNNEQLTKVVQDFIYKIDDSNKFNVKTEYNSIDEYFSSDYQNDSKLDTLLICTADTKIPIIKLEKIEKDKQLKYKFIVDLTTENEEHFLIQSFIETKEQLSQKLTQTIDALNQYPEFSKYVDDLENCL